MIKSLINLKVGVRIRLARLRNMIICGGIEANFGPLMLIKRGLFDQYTSRENAIEDDITCLIGRQTKKSTTSNLTSSLFGRSFMMRGQFVELESSS